MKKGFLLGVGFSIALFSLLVITSFTNSTKEHCEILSCPQAGKLYKDCGNIISLNSTSTFDKFTVTGATKLSGIKKNEVIIIPTSPVVKVVASKDDEKFIEQKFQVRLVPRPYVSIVDSSGQEIDMYRGVDANSLNKIKLKALCTDYTFMANYPKDARYSVSKFEALLVRGKRPVNKRPISGDTFDITELGEQKPLDRIVIKINSVTRKNFQNTILPSKVDQYIFNIPIN